jgi:uncharacterized membrane protein
MEGLWLLHKMTNDEINRREWNDSKNWSCGLFYRSRTDTRMMVPKRRGFGWTINFGKRNGVILFVALLALPLVIFLVIYFGGGHFNRR